MTKPPSTLDDLDDSTLEAVDRVFDRPRWWFMASCSMAVICFFLPEIIHSLHPWGITVHRGPTFRPKANDPYAWLAIVEMAIFITTGVFVVIIVIVMLRGGRIERHARGGRCPACGYRLHNSLSDGCTECGWHRTEGEPTSATPLARPGKGCSDTQG